MHNLVKNDLIKRYEKYSSRTNILKRTKLCDKIYLRLMEDAIYNLKNFYGVSWSQKGWEIFIGPYLHRYVNVIYDRFLFYTDLKKKNYRLKKNIDYSNLIALKRENFLDGIENINWNENLLSLIDQNFSSKLKKNSILKIITELEEKQNLIHSQSAINYFTNFLYKILKRKDQVLIYKPYWIDKYEILKLHLKLKIFPWNYNFNFKSSKPKYVSNLRLHKFKSKFKNLSQFEKLIRNIFFYILPKFYLEDIEEIKIKYKKIPLSNNIRKIYSSLCIWEDTIFKFWLSENILKLKLFYSQHGTNYGMTLYSYSQLFETKLCNYYLTWGWSDKNSKKIIPFHSIKSSRKKNYIFNKTNNKILIVNSKCFMFLPENHTGIYFGKKSQEYINQVSELLSIIPKDMKKTSYVKNYPTNEKKAFIYDLEILRRKHKDFNYIDKNKELLKIIYDYKFIINTYLSTTFLECLSLNIPTLLILNIKKSLLNIKTKKMLTKLESLKIVHKSNKELVKFINKSKFDSEIWWMDKKLQKEIKLFCNEFANPAKSLSNELYKKLA